MWQSSAQAAITATARRAQTSVYQCPVDFSVLAVTSQAPCCPMTSHVAPYTVSN